MFLEDSTGGKITCSKDQVLLLQCPASRGLAEQTARSANRSETHRVRSDISPGNPAVDTESGDQSSSHIRSKTAESETNDTSQLKDHKASQSTSPLARQRDQHSSHQTLAYDTTATHSSNASNTGLTSLQYEYIRLYSEVLAENVLHTALSEISSRALKQSASGGIHSAGSEIGRAHV